MNDIRSPWALRRVVAMVVGVTFVSACTAWRTVPLQPERFTADSSPAHVRLTLADSTKLFATHPVLRGDSLIWSEPTGSPSSEPVRHAVPTASVQRIEVHSVSGGRSALLMVGILLVAAVIAACNEVPFGSC